MLKEEGRACSAGKEDYQAKKEETSVGEKEVGGSIFEIYTEDSIGIECYKHKLLKLDKWKNLVLG